MNSLKLLNLAVLLLASCGEPETKDRFNHDEPDADADGWVAAEDCDDEVDEGEADAAVWYADADGDGYGDAEATETACSAPVDHVAVPGDGDDGDAGAQGPKKAVKTSPPRVFR